MNPKTPLFMLDRGVGPHSFFFDFDGTLFPGESLEEVLALALDDDPRRDERVQELEELGRKGMEGVLPFEESLRGRLAIVRPHRRHIDAWLAAAGRRLDPMWFLLLRDLQDAGHTVRVLSGGFRACIEPIVTAWGVPPDHINCNTFRFGSDGWVEGLVEEEPLSRTGGKPITVRSIVESGRAPGLRIMVGDGVTDLEAVSPGACHGMFGFGVTALRATVQENADIFFHRTDEFDRFVRSHFLQN